MERAQQRLSQAIHGHGSYDSDFSDEEHSEEPKKRKRTINEDDSLLKKPFQKEKYTKVAHRHVAAEELDREEARNRRFHLIAMNAYERHKKLVNDYILYYGGKKEDFRRSGEKKLAKKYYDKLFKEYCIADLSRYKDNQFGFRWRVEREVISGKGQFFCGNKRCDEKEGLKSWEVNFGYIEHGEKRNALVKLRLCQECSFRLNFHHRRKEVKPKKLMNRTEEDSEESSHKKSKLSSSKLQSSKKKKGKEHSLSEKSEGSDNENCDEEESTSEADLWKGPQQETDEKSQEEEFDEYFQDLFL
ncbi:protein FRA10AC1 isoform X2 [Monodelphis domestica]|uniref:protein FRA10AC1 isoform X2 n=1 Tax=Monodelphis domestica TaxID=13616 RepID=UPI0004432666|nr:protein FRA10AC1 isoform X2 [Monodelphis domestica]